LIQIDLIHAFTTLPPDMDMRRTPALDMLFPVGSLPPPYPPDFHMSACLYIDPATCLDAPTFDVGPRFLFWDIVHPTTAAHQVLGEYLYHYAVQYRAARLALVAKRALPRRELRGRLAFV